MCRLLMDLLMRDEQGRSGFLLVWTLLGMMLLTASALMIGFSDRPTVEALGIVLNVLAALILCPVFASMIDWVTEPARRRSIQEALSEELDRRGIDRTSLRTLTAAVGLGGLAVGALAIDLATSVDLGFGILSLLQVLAVFATSFELIRESRHKRHRDHDDEVPDS